MAVRFTSRPRQKVVIPLTPLIDIVFLLLIYFLLTTNFMVEEGVNIKLPEAKASAPQIEEEIIVYIDQEGRILLKNEEISLPRLFEALQVMIGENPDKVVMVKADRSATVDKVVKVMDMAKAAGAGRLVLATEKPF